jgi:hypothetical protein
VYLVPSSFSSLVFLLHACILMPLNACAGISIVEKEMKLKVTQKDTELVQKFNFQVKPVLLILVCVNTFPSHFSLKNNFMTVA